jgi:hypothetical protein
MSFNVCMSAFLVLSLLSGCGPDFEGTWLFQWSRSSEVVLANDQCDDVSSDMEYQGDEYEWIDIYTTTGGALVLTNGEQEWVGIAEGESFSVEATYGESDGSSYYQWNQEIMADFDGEDLDGTSDFREISSDGSDECRRQTRRSFVGVKMEGTDDASRTIGTQASQSASTN